MGRAELSVNSSPLWVKSSGQACDFAILNQLSITRKVLRQVGREFKLRPFSAGSILRLRNKIEPLASTTSVDLLLQNRSYRAHPVATGPGTDLITRPDTRGYCIAALRA